jgi:hypothetical protein
MINLAKTTVQSVLYAFDAARRCSTLLDAARLGRQTWSADLAGKYWPADLDGRLGRSDLFVLKREI